MKKLNLTSRSKKGLLAVGSGTVCVGIVALILTFSTGASPCTVEPNSSSSTVTSVSVSVGDISENTPINQDSGGATFIPSSGASQTAALTTISKPTSTPPKPVVQGDASTASNGKKTQPTNSALTNKNQKPSYASKPTASKPSSSKPPEKSRDQDPVFGNTVGTGGKMIEDKGNWGGGSQVGIMD